MHRLAVCLLLALSFQQAAAVQSQASAFDEGFIWYVANKLAAHLRKEMKFEQVEEGQRADFLADLELIYHHKLIECSGPLKEIAPYISALSWPAGENPNFDVLLAPNARAGQHIWPILQSWDAQVKVGVMVLFGSGKFSTDFPPCLVEGYMPPKAMQ